MNEALDLLARVEIRRSAKPNRFDLALIDVNNRTEIVQKDLVQHKVRSEAHKLAVRNKCAVINLA